MAVNARAGMLAKLGEDRAAGYVEDIGWEVVERNWRCRAGELDIVAREPRTDTLVFIEVKTRSGLGYGTPLEAITPAKVARLRGLAVAWLQEHGVRARRLRVDAIGILMPGSEEMQLTHVRGIGAP